MKLYIDIITSMFSAASTGTSFKWVLHYFNDAKILNATGIFGPATVTVALLVSRVWTSEYPQRFDLMISVLNLILEPSFLPST